MRKRNIDLFPYVLTALAIGGVVAVLGFHLWYIAALFFGSVAWWYFVRGIVAKDGKIILVVNIDDGEISPYIIGRARWQNTKKTGRPLGNFRSSSGSFIDVLKSYDPAENTAEYPAGGEFSDIYIASIPERYQELIDTLVSTKKENIDLSQHGEIKALELARDKISIFSDEINKVITPKKEEKAEAPDDSVA